jgi:hypothetical protein
VTDQTNQPDQTTGPTPAPTPGPSSPPPPTDQGTTPVWTPPTEPTTAPGPATMDPGEATPPPVTPPPVGETPAAAHTGRNVAIAVLVVGAILAIGSMSFAAGRAIDDDDVPGSGIHRMDRDQSRGQVPNGDQFPEGQMPNRGMFPGQDGGSGFHRGDRSGGRMGRSVMPGDGRMPGWQMPGDGWHQPGDGQLPGATQVPEATQAPSATEAPSASPSTAP